MFERSDKRRLYQLMNMFLEEQIDARTFCDEFYYSYDLEIDSDDFSVKEAMVFKELSIVVDRFSEYKEDLEKYKETYFSEDELKSRVMKTIEILC